MQNIPVQHIEVDNIPTTHAVTGEGVTAVLILHGWGGNISVVWPLAERLARTGYRVYVPDLPGFGQSPPPSSAWTVLDYARFVLAYVDHHHLEQFHLFGHSFGGRLGLILGATHGERIPKMVLANSAGIRSKPSPTKALRLNTYKAIRDGLNRVGLKTLSNSLRELYNQRYGSLDFQSTSGIMRETFLNVINEDLQAYASKVTSPTLLLWGDQDQDTPLWQGKRLEQLIPDAGLVVFEGAGHYSYLDKLHETVRVIDYFFRQG